MKSTGWVLLVVLSALTGCGGAPFTDASQVDDGGPLAETSSADPPDSGSGTFDQRVVPSEASREAGVVHEAGTVAEEAGNHEAGSSGGGSSSSGSSGSGGSSGSSSGSSGGSSSGSSNVPCDGGGLSTHHTGTGSTWTDCVPIGTYDQAEAIKACQAWCAANGCYAACFSTSVCGGENAVFGVSAGMTAEMGWSWMVAATAGDVERVDLNTGACTTAGTWN